MYRRILLGLLLMSSLAFAQHHQMRWAGEFAAALTDFSPGFALTQPGRALRVGARYYANPLLNVGVSALLMPMQTVGIDSTSRRASLMGTQGVLWLKAANGTWLRESARLAPTLGLGIAYAQFDARAGVNMSLHAGIHVRISRDAWLLTEATHAFALTAHAPVYTSYLTGFVFAIPTGSKNRPIPRKEIQPVPMVASRDSMRVQLASDRDADGTPDTYDDCPDEAGSRDNHGCPQGEQAGGNRPGGKTNDLVVIDNNVAQQPVSPPATTSIAPADNNRLQAAAMGVFFAEGQAAISPNSAAALAEVAAILQQYPEYRLRIVGHTDNTGDPGENLVLSIKRANEVKYYLAREHGLRLSRMTAEGAGDTRPTADNASALGRQQNRRVEFILFRDP